MTEHTIADNLSRLVTAKTDIASAITDMGGTVGSGDGFEEFPEDIRTIGTGVGPVQSDWNQNDSTADDYIKNKPTNATTSSSGFMSAADKAKLDAIDEQYHYVQPIFDYNATTEKTYLTLHAYTESGAEVIDHYPTTVQVPLANTDNSENPGLINGSMYLSGTGNVVTGISLSNGTFTITKGMNAMSVPSAGSGISVSLGGTGSTTLTSNAILAGNGTSAIKKISTASGALFATSSGGAASFGTLPVAQGGTGATSASSARTNLGLGSAATYSATSSVTSGSSSLVTSGAVHDTIETMSCRRVLVEKNNSSTTYTYVMTKNDFYISDASLVEGCGMYLISIVTWSTMPSMSLYMVGYGGGAPRYSTIQKIAGSDASISVSGDTITIITSGKVSIFALN